MKTPQLKQRSTSPVDAHQIDRPKILLAGKLTAMDAPGGGEIQMLALADSLKKMNVDARLWRPWEDRLAQSDCVHLFGSVPEHLPVVEAARRHNVPVVLSTIAWFDLGSYWREPRSLPARLAAVAGFVARAGCPRLPSWRRRLYQAVDLALPNSNAEAEQLVRYFGLPYERIHVVPNGAEVRFADADPGPFAKLVGAPGFVLCAGRIEPRKNQLGLLKAMRGTSVPIVILGDVVPGCESYARACREIAGPAVRFVARFDHQDPMLASAYAACGCLVMPSWFETPGLAALEAAMTGTPLVLPHGGAAREYFADDAEYVKPGHHRAIRHAVFAAILQGRSAELAQRARRTFSQLAVAKATCQAYERVI
jgi:glycosyltransferase involved in cell wall biosynthesis